MSNEFIKTIDDNYESSEIEMVESVITETIEEIEIDVDEAMGWAGGDYDRHYSLLGRNDPNQHEIKAIVGLREELDELERLKTVYSDKTGVANYYSWNDGVYDEYGYFVSMVPNTTNVEICTGKDIFGVTVLDAGFVGGQDENAPRGNDYALVVTSGLVNVRCESTVAEGDSVVSNSYGIATKTDTEGGYKVIAIEYKDGVTYAVISLGIQASTIDSMGKKIQNLDDRMDTAENNIAEAMRVANDTHNKLGEYTESNKDISNKVNDALGVIDRVASEVEDMSEQLVNSTLVAAQAKAIAANAVQSAEAIRETAVSLANEALDRAAKIEKTVEPISKWEYVDPITGATHTGATYFDEYVKNGLSTKVSMETVEKLNEENKLLIEQNAENYQRLISSVDKYSVGEYSQAYGLTAQQARNILKEGMIYIPTKHDSALTHVEEYSDGNNVLSYEFTYGNSYEFYPSEDGSYIWYENVGDVWFGTEEPSGSAYLYWYDGENLYIFTSDQWTKVNTLSGNVNSRITSMIRQTTNSIEESITNMSGDVASSKAWIDNNSANIQGVVTWKNDNAEAIATTMQSASDSEAYIAQIASVKNDDGTINAAASIVTAVNNDESSVGINADRIVMTGTTTFLQPDDLGDNGSTVISGSRITTGELDAEKVKVINLQASSIIVTGNNNTTVKDFIDKSVVSTTVYYALSNSVKTPPEDETWDEEEPERTSDKPYMWQKTVIVYGDGSMEESMASIDGKGAINIDITSSTGTIYINNEIKTTLTARVLQDNVDITVEFPDNAFLWEKYDMYGAKDTVWSYTGKTVAVSNIDIYKRAMFNCVLDVEQRI